MLAVAYATAPILYSMSGGNMESRRVKRMVKLIVADGQLFRDVENCPLEALNLATEPSQETIDAFESCASKRRPPISDYAYRLWYQHEFTE